MGRLGCEAQPASEGNQSGWQLEMRSCDGGAKSTDLVCRGTTEVSPQDRTATAGAETLERLGKEGCVPVPGCRNNPRAGERPWSKGDPRAKGRDQKGPQMGY